MVKSEVKNYVVKCPITRRKLMEIKSEKEPIVEICLEGFEKKYDIVTKCPTSKVFVGIII